MINIFGSKHFGRKYFTVCSMIEIFSVIPFYTINQLTKYNYLIYFMNKHYRLILIFFVYQPGAILNFP